MVCNSCYTDNNNQTCCSHQANDAMDKRGHNGEYCCITKFGDESCLGILSPEVFNVSDRRHQQTCRPAPAASNSFAASRALPRIHQSHHIDIQLFTPITIFWPLPSSQPMFKVSLFSCIFVFLTFFDSYRLLPSIVGLGTAQGASEKDRGDPVRGDL